MAKLTSFRLPEELHQKLKAIAQSRGHTVNQLLLSIVWEWLKAQ